MTEHDLFVLILNRNIEIEPIVFVCLEMQFAEQCKFNYLFENYTRFYNSFYMTDLPYSRFNVVIERIQRNKITSNTVFNLNN